MYYLKNNKHTCKYDKGGLMTINLLIQFKFPFLYLIYSKIL